MSDISRPKTRKRVRDRTRKFADAGTAEKVGYKNPPKHTRWTKGHCPNPKGRPKGSKNYRTILNEILDSEIDIRNSKGDVQKVSVRKAYLMKLAEKALKGEARPAEIIMREESQMLNAEADDRKKNRENSERDDEISDDILDEYFRQRLELEMKKEKDDDEDK